MSKTIYCYFNEADLKCLLDSLSSKGILLYDNQKPLVSLPQVVYDNIIEIELCDEAGGQIYFSPCMVINGYLQCGMFWLKESDNIASNKLYSSIKKHIRSNFVFSKNNVCYYGKGMFEDWRERKYRFPVLLEYEKYVLEENKMESLFAMLKKLNIHVKADMVRLRNADIIDLNARKFIIYYNEDLLVRTIVNKSIVRYEYDSVCIFVYKNEKKRSYTLMMDSRLMGQYPDLERLFEQIKKI